MKEWSSFCLLWTSLTFAIALRRQMPMRFAAACFGYYEVP